MKWDKANKEKLYRLLWMKVYEIRIRHCGVKPMERFALEHRAYEAFLESFGIVRVEKVRQPLGRSSWWARPHTRKPIRSRNHILVYDPSKLPRTVPRDPRDFQVCIATMKRPDLSHKEGLQIPKEVAEKFLVLGVP